MAIVDILLLMTKYRHLHKIIVARESNFPIADKCSIELTTDAIAINGSKFSFFFK